MQIQLLLTSANFGKLQRAPETPQRTTLTERGLAGVSGCRGSIVTGVMSLLTPHGRVLSTQTFWKLYVLVLGCQSFWLMSWTVSVTAA